MTSERPHSQPGWMRGLPGLALSISRGFRLEWNQRHLRVRLTQPRAATVMMHCRLNEWPSSYLIVSNKSQRYCKRLLLFYTALFHHKMVAKTE